MKINYIAEVSSNHNSSLERSLKLIDMASDSGCTSVKFQLFKIDQLFSPEILAKSEEHRRRKKWELPIEFLPKLADHAKKRGLLFSCTPFYLDAVDELEPYVDFYKVASYELLWKDLLIKIAKTGKPVIISTGMANMEEIEEAVKVLEENNCKDITILHCVSSYPAKAEECNLRVIETYKKKFGYRVGWSDHTVSNAVINRAVHKWGAEVLELHIDLDGSGEEFESGHCWLPESLSNLINSIETALITDGDGVKNPSPSEMMEREWRADPSDGLRPFLKLRQTWKPE